MKSDPIDTVARFGAALSDPTRLRLWRALRGGELCACQLIELVGLAPSSVSKHLALLRDAGLVVSRKDGRWVHFRLADKAGFPVPRSAASAILRTLEKSPALRADAARLKAIRRANPETLCRNRRER